MALTTYCSLDDIRSRVRAYCAVSVTSNPTEDEVTSLIEEASAQLNGALTKAKYTTVPVTGENDLALARSVVANKVAMAVLFRALGFSNVPESIRLELSGWRQTMTDLANGVDWLVDQRPARKRIRTVQFQRQWGEEWNG